MLVPNIALIFKMAVPAYTPTCEHEDSHYPTLSPALGIAGLYNFCHSVGCELYLVVSLLTKNHDWKSWVGEPGCLSWSPSSAFAIGPWAGYLSPLHLRFLICRGGVTTVSPPGVSELTQVKSWGTQCALSKW